MYYGTGSNASVTISFVMAPQPTCSECGLPQVCARHPDGRLFCAACVDVQKRKDAIASAEAWIEAAFCAVVIAGRARLLRSLAAAFHPDVGGDPQLMIALNRVRERYPSPA